MSGLIVLILIPILLPVGLLSVPLAFEARGRLAQDKRRLEGKLTWGWGLLAATVGVAGRQTSIRLRLAGMGLPTPRRKHPTVKAKTPGKKAGRKRERHGFDLSMVSTALSRKLLAVAFVYLKTLFRSLRLRLQVTGTYGTDDPALTGLLAGLFAALHAEHLNLDLGPDFDGPILDVAGETSGRIIPIVILWLTIRLLLAKPVRRLWWTLLKTKFIRRKPKEAAQYV